MVLYLLQFHIPAAGSKRQQKQIFKGSTCVISTSGPGTFFQTGGTPADRCVYVNLLLSHLATTWCVCDQLTLPGEEEERRWKGTETRQKNV